MDKNIQKYLAFVKTVECGSFTKAAETLSYSQSGISRMINDLEKEWGMSLLERGRAGVRLTSDGLMMLPYAQNVCNDYQKLLIQVDELNGLQSGLIRIGTISSVAIHWLPNIIRKFQESYPNIDYELLIGDYEDIENWLLEGRADCGFLRLPTLPELETIFLEQEKQFVVMAENHPLVDCKRFPVNALADYPFILWGKGAQVDIMEIFQRCNIYPKVYFTTWDDHVIMSMVENGLCISILPQLVLRRMPFKVVAKELEIPVYREIGLALRDKKSASLVVRRFLDYLQYRGNADNTEISRLALPQ